MKSGSIAVVGCGRVGFAHLDWLLKRGHPAVGYDSNALVQARISDYLGPTVAVTDFTDLSDCEAIHICVPTEPSPDGSADLTILEDVVGDIAGLEHRGARITYVSQRSTCPPETADRMSTMLSNIHYGVNPSFLRKASINEDVSNPDRIAYGGPPTS